MNDTRSFFGVEASDPVHQPVAKPLAQSLASRGTAATKAANADGQFFPTRDVDVIRALTAYESFFDRSRRVWEPHCGEGHIARELAAQGHQVTGSDLTIRTTIEAAEAEGWELYPLSRDFFGVPVMSPLTVEGVVMNPPFKGAHAHIRRGLDLGFPYVAALLPLTFFARSTHNLRLFMQFPPARVLPITWKVDFTGEGNAIYEVQWCVWERDEIVPGAASLYRPLPRVSNAGGLL